MRAFTLLRILFTLEIAGRIEAVSDWFQRSGERQLDRACKRWPDFHDYAYERIAPDTQTGGRPE